MWGDNINSTDLIENKNKFTVNRQNLYEVAVDSILNYIIANDLKNGDKLPTENELKNIFGISRNTLREALKSLQLIGIIESKQNVGIIIKEFNIANVTKFVPYSLRMEDNNLKGLAEAREWLEYSILPMIVEKRTEEDLEKLWGIIEKIDCCIKDNMEVYEWDYSFHQILVECCKNKFINGMNIVLKEFFTLYIKNNLKKNGEYVINKSVDILTNDEHKIIFKAMKIRNLEMLKKIIKKHFIYTYIE